MPDGKDVTRPRGPTVLVNHGVYTTLGAARVFLTAPGMSPQFRRVAGRSGYTLIELITVVVLVGVVYALAAPRLTGYMSNQKVQRAMDRMASDVGFARIQAVREGQPVQLILTGYRTYDVKVLDGTAAGKIVRNTDLGMASGVTLGPSGSSVTFDSRGLLTAGSATFTATRGSYTAQITITPIGRVRRDY